MDWFAPVDIYCERTGPEFWSEPLNALSNAAFLVAALLGYYTARQRGVLRWTVWSAIILVAMIGVGSFLFHTFSTTWSGLADVIPIWTFVLWFLILSVHYQSGAKSLLRTTAIVIAALVAIGAIIWMIGTAATTGSAAPQDGDRFNGSTQYLPAVFALYAFTIVMLWRRDVGRWWVLAASVTFTVSLGFRTVDLWVCPSFAHGTHMVWHLLNGVMIGLLLQELIRRLDPMDV